MMKTSHNPALQQTPKAINVLSVDLAAHVLASAMSYAFMFVVVINQSIAGVLIGRNKRNIIRHRAPNESVKRSGISILDDSCDNHSLASDSADDRNLASCSACVKTFGQWFVFFFSADESFIYFNFSTQGNKITFHRRSPSHAHIPACVIVRAGIVAEDYAVNLQGADSFFADKHQITNLEPKIQRYLCILKNGVSDDRKAVAIASATISILANPVKRPGFQFVYFLASIAARAMNPVGPTHISEKLIAGLLRPELS